MGKILGRKNNGGVKGKCVKEKNKFICKVQNSEGKKGEIKIGKNQRGGFSIEKVSGDTKELMKESREMAKEYLPNEAQGDLEGQGNGEF